MNVHYVPSLYQSRLRDVHAVPVDGLAPEVRIGWVLPALRPVKVAEIENETGREQEPEPVCQWGLGDELELSLGSGDGGRSWSLPQEVYNSEIDDRDASLRPIAMARGFSRRSAHQS